MRIGLVCPEFPGHLNPLTSLGSELRRRGHQVSLIGGRFAERFAKRAELEFVPMGVEGDLDLQVTELSRELGKLSGFASMRQTGRILGQVVKITQRDLLKILENGQFDGLVVDQLSPGAYLVATAHGLPCAIACNALSLHYDPWLPFPPMPWSYRRDWYGLIRNKLAHWLVRPLYDWCGCARSTGVRPSLLAYELHHGLAQIAQQPSFFDFPRKFTPDHFHYTGPWHTETRDDDMDFPWDRLDDRPLIYASMGTLQNNLEYVFSAIIDAVRDLPAQVVLTQGGASGDLNLQMPENVILVKHAPQLRLLDRAVMAITHAGLNTALECITRGVPMVCLPVTNDQPGVAKRVEWLGMGEMLPVLRVNGARLRKLVRQVFQNEAYVAKTTECRQQLAQTNGLEMASRIVEMAFTTKTQVKRDTLATPQLLN